MNFQQWTALFVFCGFIFGVTLDYIRRRQGKVPPARLSEILFMGFALIFVIGLCTSAFFGTPPRAGLGSAFGIVCIVFFVFDKVPKRKIPLTLFAMAITITWVELMELSLRFVGIANGWLDALFGIVGPAGFVYLGFVLIRYGFSNAKPPRHPLLHDILRKPIP